MYFVLWRWYTLVAIDVNIDSQKYIDVLDENSWPVVFRHLVANRGSFRMITLICIVVYKLISEKNVQDISSRSVSCAAQSLDVNIIVLSSS